MRGKGRPRIGWDEHMQKLTRKTGKTLQEVTRMSGGQEST